jgi:FAD/FMN-containing dehydrogenase
MNNLPQADVVPYAGHDVLAEPGEQRYETGRRAFNLSADQRPERVALPRDEQDVIFAVRFAAEFGMSIAAQRTGHGATKLESLENTLLLRTDEMTNVTIDPRERHARVQAGARWEDVVPAASRLGLAALHGSSPDVGVVGYTLGGGIGWYARWHGLAADHVSAIELVTADGQLRRVDQATDPELFWALRGGGGNLGIVTALEFELLPVTELYAGALFFPWERSDEVLHAWNDWKSTLPDELTSLARILQFPPLPQIPEPLRGNSFAIVEVAYLGSEANGAEVMDPLRRLGPALDTLAAVPPVDISELHMDPREPVAFTDDHQLLEHLPDKAIDELISLIGPDSGSPLLTFELRHLGGALSRPKAGRGALGAVRGEVSTFGVGLAADPSASQAVREHLAMVRNALEPYDTGYALSNFMLQPADPSRFFEPATLARLEQVRRSTDPHGVFSSPRQA